MDKNNVLEELLNLINNVGIKNMDDLSSGLLYRYGFENGLHTLTVGIRQEAESGSSEFGAFREDVPVHELYFDTDYELIKYLIWTTYNIEISDIFDLEKDNVEFININFYKDIKLNSLLKEVLSIIRNDEKLEKAAAAFLEAREEKENEIDNIFEDLDIREAKDIILDRPVYSGEEYGNNCGYAWDNITNFKILDFSINYKREREKPFYSLDVKFQIESFLEESNTVNYYDVEIPGFLIFPSSSVNDNDKKMLKNNLSLIYGMTEDTLYSMLIKEFSNFREYPVTISKIDNGMNLANFKEEALSKLSRYLISLFYVGSRNIYTEEDITDLCNEFMKRSFFEFKKHLFSEFVISSTGIRINDLNTVNSFYTMIEKIASRFEKEKENERI